MIRNRVIKAGLALEAQAPDELAVNALAYTSGTTSRPKGVEYTHRGCYMGAVGNIIESGLNYHGTGRCKYLWTLPMFHATGWTFPWAITAVRGTHYCLRKIDYPEIWRLLKEEGITHYKRRPDCQHLTLQRQERRKTRTASPRNRRRQPTYRASIRDDAESQPPSRPCLRPD